MGRQTAADTSRADSADTFPPPGCSPCRSAPNQPSVLCREQNRGGPLRGYSRVRSFECAIRCACCSSSLNRKPVSSSQVIQCVQAGAALRATWDGCRAAALRGTEPDPQSPAGCCPL